MVVALKRRTGSTDETLLIGGAVRDFRVWQSVVNLGLGRYSTSGMPAPSRRVKAWVELTASSGNATPAQTGTVSFRPGGVTKTLTLYDFNSRMTIVFPSDGWLTLPVSAFTGFDCGVLTTGYSFTTSVGSSRRVPASVEWNGDLVRRSYLYAPYRLRVGSTTYAEPPYYFATRQTNGRIRASTVSEVMAAVRLIWFDLPGVNTGTITFRATPTISTLSIHSWMYIPAYTEILRAGTSALESAVFKMGYWTR